MALHVHLLALVLEHVHDTFDRGPGIVDLAHAGPRHRLLPAKCLVERALLRGRDDAALEWHEPAMDLVVEDGKELGRACESIDLPGSDGILGHANEEHDRFDQCSLKLAGKEQSVLLDHGPDGNVVKDRMTLCLGLVCHPFIHLSVFGRVERLVQDALERVPLVAGELLLARVDE